MPERGPARRFLEAPLRRPRTVAVLTLAGCLASLAMALLATPLYRASVRVLVRADGAAEGLRERAGGETTEARTRALRLRLLALDRVGRVLEEEGPGRESPDLPPSARVDRLRKATRVRETAPGTFLVSLEDADAERAARMLNRLIRLFLEDVEKNKQAVAAAAALEVRLEEGRRAVEARKAEIERLGTRREYDAALREYLALFEEWRLTETAGRLRAGGFAAVTAETAGVPQRPCCPSRALLLLAGLGIGLVFGLLAAVVAEARDPSVRDAEDLEELLPHPLLAEIPFVRAGSRGGGDRRR